MKVSLGVRNLIYIILSLIFLVFSFLTDLFPEKIIQDSLKIDQIIKNIKNTNIEDSFEKTAYFLNLISFGQVKIFIVLQAIFYAFLLTRFFVYVKHFIFFILLLVPNLILNVLIPGKEIVVIFLTILITLSIKYFKLKYANFILITVLYLCYAYHIRAYYFLIFAVFVFLYLLTSFKKIKYRICLLMTFLIFIFLLPNELYSFLFSHREISNTYALNINSVNRTVINNLFIPTNFIELIINYLYVMSVMLFPVFYFFTYKELFLMFLNSFIIIYFFKIYKLKHSLDTRILYSLFYAHLFVLFIFEPDLGSYLRHLTSCSIYFVGYMYMIQRDKIEKK
tara:strand:+ start:32754 stop:33764 length:1011 start_codon:yes stop_codon:yes gene_type:complete